MRAAASSIASGSQSSRSQMSRPPPRFSLVEHEAVFRRRRSHDEELAPPRGLQAAEPGTRARPPGAAARVRSPAPKPSRIASSRETSVAAVEQVLEVVETQQELPPLTEKTGGTPPAAARAPPAGQGPGDRRSHQRRVGERRQVHEGHAVPVRAFQLRPAPPAPAASCPSRPARSASPAGSRPEARARGRSRPRARSARSAGSEASRRAPPSRRQERLRKPASSASPWRSVPAKLVMPGTSSPRHRPHRPPRSEGSRRPRWS